MASLAVTSPCLHSLGSVYDVAHCWSHTLVTPWKCSLKINLPLSTKNRIAISAKSSNSEKT